MVECSAAPIDRGYSISAEAKAGTKLECRGNCKVGFVPEQQLRALSMFPTADSAAFGELGLFTKMWLP